MTDKLKPCPFCGHKKVLVEEIDDTGLYIAECKRCFATSAILRPRERVIQAWNRRADDGYND